VSSVLPRHPVYVISKGRWGSEGLTAKFLIEDGVPFKLVVEPQEREQYADVFGAERLHVLPFSNLRQGSIPARNWVWEHAKTSGAERHWILDDNIRKIYRRWRAMRVPCNAGPAFAAVEDFIDRYENIAVAGMQYVTFCPDRKPFPVFVVNCHVYSCMLIRCGLPYRWRGRYNEDTDLCLQVLSGGWCTLLTNVFLAQKQGTMTMKGGNTDELYQGDGRLEMARSLERVWPGIVKVTRRFNRPQHIVDWKRFRTKLRPKPEFKGAEGRGEYGMQLRELREVKSPTVRKMIDESRKDEGG
jgi:hypothetical protein